MPLPECRQYDTTPDSSFSNGTLNWEINYREPLGTGNLPVSSYYRNIIMGQTLQQLYSALMTHTM